jgi:hypothetical protein
MQVNVTRTLVLIAAAVLFLSFGYTEMAGSDMWWHLAAGRQLVQTGSPWMVDNWSFTAYGHPWLNHEWLADLIYFGWASAWGVDSLVYWKWLVIVAAFMLLLVALNRASGNPVVALLCAGVALANAAPFLDVRPHLYSVLGYCLLLVLAHRRRANPWLLALVFVVWVNLHGGFFFGLMALAILLFPWRKPGLPALRSAAGVGVLCVLACLLNPSGIKLFLYPLAYAFDATSPFRQIGEWLPPFKAGGIRAPLFFYLMWLPLAGLLYLLRPVRRELEVPWEGLALTALTLAMALTSRRFIPLFGISLALMLAPLLGLAARRLRLDRLNPALAVLALLFALYRQLPYPLQSGPAFHYLTAEYSYPVDTLNFIEANGIHGNVFALWNWGGYIHWRSDGRLKVYVDGRADTIFDADTYRNYVTVLGSYPGWVALLESSGADYMLWPHYRSRGRDKLRQLLDTGRWRPVYSDAVSWLLARTDRVPETPLQPSPPGPWQEMTRATLSDWAGNDEETIRHAEAVRAVLPWQRDACNLLIAVYRKRQDGASADRVRMDCLDYFPSTLLR